MGCLIAIKGDNTMTKQSRGAPKVAKELTEARKGFRAISAAAEADPNPVTKGSAKWRIAIQQAKAEVLKAELIDAYGHFQGTPETYAQIDAIPASRRQPPLARMFENGQLSQEQWQAACEIEAIAETIERAVNVRSASLEARVDNSGAGRDTLIESLGRIRLEITYSAWRNALPMPRRMYLDLILVNRPLTATARVYNQPWRAVRERLMRALDRWCEIKEATWNNVDEADVAGVYARLGCGILLPPRPRAMPAAGPDD